MNSRSSGAPRQDSSKKTPPRESRESVRFNIQSGSKFKDKEGVERTSWSTLGTAFENFGEKGRTIKLIFDRGMPHPDADLVLFEASSDEGHND